MGGHNEKLKNFLPMSQKIMVMEKFKKKIFFSKFSKDIRKCHNFEQKWKYFLDQKGRFSETRSLSDL